MASGRWAVVALAKDWMNKDAKATFVAFGPFYEWMNASNQAITLQGEGYDAQIIELQRPEFKALED